MPSTPACYCRRLAHSCRPTVEAGTGGAGQRSCCVIAPAILQNCVLSETKIGGLLLQAEDLALEDCLYALDKAMQNGSGESHSYWGCMIDRAYP